MGYSAWDCMVGDLWPGNSMVDWVLFESYWAYADEAYAPTTALFYNFLTQNSTPAHNYISKPWGLGEFGTVQPSVAGQEDYYLQMKATLDNNTFPNIKLYSTFDDPGYGDVRVAYNYNSVFDPKELANYVALADDPAVLAGNTSALHP
jgi:hypothetical protein